MIEIRRIKALDAVVRAPPSKAHTLRALFIAALAEGISTIKNPLLANDQLTAIKALEKFGVKIDREKQGKELVVRGSGGQLKLPKKVDAGESGVTMRFLASLASVAGRQGQVCTIDASPRMRKRPVDGLVDSLRGLGAVATYAKTNGFPPINVEGSTLFGGKAFINARHSSQFLSSLLIAAPYAEEDVELVVDGVVASKPYIEITLETMGDFGVKVGREGFKRFSIQSGQRYKARQYGVEGDYSSAAYFFAAAAVTRGKVRVKNLRRDTKQGDAIFPKLLERMGCFVKRIGNEIEVQGPDKLKPVSADMRGCPDIAMTLAVVAAFANGKSAIENVSHLRLKESDRLAATIGCLRKIGAKAETNGTDIIVYGNPKKLHGATIDPRNDHRIAMSLAVAGLKVRGMKILGEECVQKSFPNFWEELEAIGN